MSHLNAILQSLPILQLEFLSLLAYFLIILLFYIFLGKEGLYTFIAVAVVGANLQVLKLVDFPFFKDPVALGTVLFSSTYFCTDILAEYEGHIAARKGVWVGFMAMLLWTLITSVTIGFKPLDPTTTAPAWEWALPAHEQISALFVRIPSLFLAGMAAYLVSQYHDIFLYRLLQRRHGKKLLWLRNNLSTMLSALIDNIVFSLLAWVILAEEPIALSVVIRTYILGTYILRLVVALLDTPFLYLFRYVMRLRLIFRKKN